MRKFLIWFSVGIGVIIIFIAAIYFILSALFDDEPYVAQNSYLTGSVWGPLPEYSISDAIEEYIGGSVLDMVKLRKSFRMAAVDDRIKGIIIRIGFVQAGFAKLTGTAPINI